MGFAALHSIYAATVCWFFVGAGHARDRGGFGLAHGCD